MLQRIRQRSSFIRWTVLVFSGTQVHVLLMAIDLDWVRDATFKKNVNSSFSIILDSLKTLSLLKERKLASAQLASMPAVQWAWRDCSPQSGS